MLFRSVTPSGEVPLIISRNKAGEVSISSSRPFTKITYSINNGKPLPYVTVLALRDGGEVSAWQTGNPGLKTTQRFSKIEQIPTTVYFASSEEAGEGNAAHLTDGDTNTIWHTMYSVTVAKHPHWVDLDAGEVKTIRGFTYLPRTDGGNGNVKDYTIQVSMDGKEWSEPVKKGRFANNRNEKRVEFDIAVKARYVRFTALSEQNGQDYASGAELTIF